MSRWAASSKIHNLLTVFVKVVKRIVVLDQVVSGRRYNLIFRAFTAKASMESRVHTVLVRLVNALYRDRRQLTCAGRPEARSNRASPGVDDWTSIGGMRLVMCRKVEPRAYAGLCRVAGTSIR